MAPFLETAALAVTAKTATREAEVKSILNEVAEAIDLGGRIEIID